LHIWIVADNLSLFHVRCICIKAVADDHTDHTINKEHAHKTITITTRNVKKKSTSKTKYISTQTTPYFSKQMTQTRKAKIKKIMKKKKNYHRISLVIWRDHDRATQNCMN
jgi:PleD family two-component response regulator